MANIIRIIGVVAICTGIALIVVALRPLSEGQSLVMQNFFLLNQAVTAISGGVIALGIGQLIAVNQRISEDMADLYEFIRNRDGEEEETGEAREPPRQSLANVPNYDPRRDPPVVKESTHRARTVLTLKDGTVAVETSQGWKRFRTIRDFDRLLPA